MGAIKRKGLFIGQTSLRGERKEQQGFQLIASLLPLRGRVVEGIMERGHDYFSTEREIPTGWLDYISGDSILKL